MVRNAASVCDPTRHRPHHPYFDETFVTGDPIWLARTFNLFHLWVIVFCMFILQWIIRHSRGAERVYLTAWLFSVLVDPVKDFVSTPSVLALNWLQTLVWLAATIATVWLLVKLPPRNELASVNRN
jgi:hypothetical protein